MQAGMERKLVFHPEVELVVRAAKDNSVRQLRQVRELLQLKPDLFRVITPVEPRRP
jgi:hypothetical protein